MLVEVDWSELRDGDDAWTEGWSLYAYLGPEDDDLVYLGQAGPRSSPVDRWNARDKEALFAAIEADYGLDPEDLTVLFGGVFPPGGRRISRELLTDVESLLIQELQPWGNIQCRSSRTRRPGLRVACLGEWPFEDDHFVDR